MFSFFRTASRHRRREEIDLLVDIYGQNTFIITFLKESNMALSKEVQAILDRAKQNTSLVQSVDLGMQGLSKQVADLQAQISGMQPGNVLSDEDKAALAEAASNLDTSIAMLQSDIPANTPQAGGGSQSSGSTADASTGSAPQGGQQTQADQSGALSSDNGPKPLAGTGPAGQ